MNIKKLKEHIKLCRKNLNNNRTKCCLKCPFEEEIIGYYPELEEKFKQKRKLFNEILNYK